MSGKFVVTYNDIPVHTSTDSDQGYQEAHYAFYKILSGIVWPTVYETVPGQRSHEFVRIGRITLDGTGKHVHVWDYLQLRFMEETSGQSA